MKCHSRNSGTSLVELLIVSALVSGLLITAASVMTSFVHRMAADLQLERTERAANRLMAEFTSSMARAHSYRIHADATNWGTTSPGTQGNFILLDLPDGTQIGFSYQSGEIQLINIHTGQRLVCHRNATVNGTFVSMPDGLPSLNWSVNLPGERVTFRCNANPLYMQ